MIFPAPKPSRTVVFAWWPVRLEDGRVAWLQQVNRRFVCSWADGYWEYYL